MSNLGNEIKKGLKEAIADAKQRNLKRNYVYIEPIKQFSSKEIRQIRKDIGLTQKLFAGYLGVSTKTIEAWEEGINRPSGVASRILTMIEKDNKIVKKYPFVVS